MHSLYTKNQLYVFTAIIAMLTTPHGCSAALIGKDFLPKLGQTIFTKVADTAHLCATQCDLKQQELVAADRNKALLEEKYADKVKQLYQESIHTKGHRLSEKYRDLYFYQSTDKHVTKLEAWSRLSLLDKAIRVTAPLSAAFLGGVGGACITGVQAYSLTACCVCTLTTFYVARRFFIQHSDPASIARMLSAYRELAIQGLATLDATASTSSFERLNDAHEYCKHYDRVEEEHKRIGRLLISESYIPDEYGEPVFQDLKERRQELSGTLNEMATSSHMRAHQRILDKEAYLRLAQQPLVPNFPITEDHCTYHDIASDFKDKELQLYSA